MHRPHSDGGEQGRLPARLSDGTLIGTVKDVTGVITGDPDIYG
ncbi:hypothetical protein [Streptomyces sp. AC550_RSS872]|nr:hypothetical protein [Streptomyces sp. AC550_RSS872]